MQPKKAWIATLCAAFLFFLLAHSVVRGFADDAFPVRNVSAVEELVFLVSPPQALQEHVQARDIVWLDALAFISYTFWFVCPVVMCMALVRKAPTHLLRYFTWMAVVTVVADVCFFVLPVSPPWMEEGVSRVLLDRSFTEYIGKDNNEVASFPSLHAGLPMLIGLFFLTVPGGRRLAWFCMGYAVTVGASVAYLGEHWVIDVLAGYAVAVFAAWLCTSQHMHRLYARIPGDPVGRLSRLNARMCDGKSEVEPAPLHVPEPLREAA